jgi:hypothetical protein
MFVSCSVGLRPYLKENTVSFVILSHQPFLGPQSVKTAITFIFHKVLGISFLAEEMLAFQGGLCCMESVRVFRDMSYPNFSSFVANHSAMYRRCQGIFSNCTGICMRFRLMYLLHVTLSSLMPLAVISFINGAITHNHPVCCFIALTACWYSAALIYIILRPILFFCADFDFKRSVFCLLQQHYAFSTSIDMIIMTKVKLPAWIQIYIRDLIKFNLNLLSSKQFTIVVYELNKQQNLKAYQIQG